jgi:hypothetical protein
VSVSSKNASGNSSSSRRLASKTLNIRQYAQATLAEGDVTSWDATNFTLTWTTNDATAAIIHFIAIGGAGVSAKVLEWTTLATTGSQSVTGVGFQPTVLFTANIDTNVSNSLPNHEFYGFGVGDAGGHQWIIGQYAIDGLGTSSTYRGQRTDAFVYVPNGAGNPHLKASLVSMDADGFTASHLYAPGSTRQIITLALAGVNMMVGSFNKSTGASGSTQDVTGFGFQPSAVFLSSFLTTTMANDFGVAHARMAVGASDGTTQGVSAVTDTNGLNTSAVFSREETSAALIKIDNQTGTVDASATTSMLANGFRMTWTTNDAVASEILYVALGPLAVTAVTLTSFTATPMPGGRIRLAWRTGYEVDNVGFRVYREQNGKRVRITSSIVPGTALIGVGRGASNGDRDYSFSDKAPSTDPGPVQYWLEDVDLKGKSTWHGPIVPASAPDRGPR